MSDTRLELRRTARTIAAGTVLLLLSAACSSQSAKDTAAVSTRSAPASQTSTTPPATNTTTATPATPPSATAKTPAPTTQSPSDPGATGLGGCPVAPADSVWRARVDHLPVATRSVAYVASIGATQHVHADFGAGFWDGGPIGIPITLIPPGTKPAHITFDYAAESDKGPYPIPPNASVEGGPQASGDRHVIALDPSNCTDYELYSAHSQAGTWTAGSGAIFPLRSDTLRPTGWTSADAAGLPILPGLARFDEAATGIDHALRITVPRTQSTYLWPARHQASNNTDPALPPMGLRLRLKASVDISKLPPQARAVAQALKTYGAIVADNGSAWYISGTPNDHWSNDQLQRLSTLTGTDFEAVDESALRISADSGAARAG